MNQSNIFMAFFRVGILGYGGGPASIPLIQKEAVDIYKWMDEEEFSDTLAIGNTLPGPIATKLAGYIGYRVGGILGMINAIVASVIPTVILMIILLTSLASFREYEWVQGMTKGVLPVVAVMLGVLTWGFIEKSKNDLGWLKAIFLIIISIVLIELAGIHPAIIIGLLIIIVLVNPFSRSLSKEAGEKE
ncbi:chromate transporter [Salipaludibacillus neizhouensis]|uniref:Chromate transporter n=1 Tax=Salipaludibacillus neizhouensis TaxID=885475 RepID=A0A3A9K722_9BACI|nr:chromate transporter [Salipaludibacillus neizhouensis]RKL66131.1 chromate transporter [Salipaludibacillus neizhouensis]